MFKSKLSSFASGILVAGRARCDACTSTNYCFARVLVLLINNLGRGEGLYFYCPNDLSDGTTKSPDSKRHIVTQWLRFHPAQIVQGSLPQYLSQGQTVRNLMGEGGGGSTKKCSRENEIEKIHGHQVTLKNIHAPAK